MGKQFQPSLDFCNIIVFRVLLICLKKMGLIWPCFDFAMIIGSICDGVNVVAVAIAIIVAVVVVVLLLLL